MGVDRCDAADQLGHAYRRIDELARALSAEQALTRELRAVIALGPYNAVRRPRLAAARGTRAAKAARASLPSRGSPRT